MTELEGTIRFWQAVLDGPRFQLKPSAVVHIETTIKHLKQLQEIVRHVHVAPE